MGTPKGYLWIQPRVPYISQQLFIMCCIAGILDVKEVSKRYAFTSRIPAIQHIINKVNLPLFKERGKFSAIGHASEPAKCPRCRLLAPEKRVQHGRYLPPRTLNDCITKVLYRASHPAAALFPIFSFLMVVHFWIQHVCSGIFSLSFTNRAGLCATPLPHMGQLLVLQEWPVRRRQPSGLRIRL